MIGDWKLEFTSIGGEVVRAKESAGLFSADVLMLLIEGRLHSELAGETLDKMLAPCTMSAVEGKDGSGKLELLLMEFSCMIGEMELFPNHDWASAASVAEVLSVELNDRVKFRECDDWHKCT
jgi:hypothetical protein